jgi:hypothetical protein
VTDSTQCKERIHHPGAESWIPFAVSSPILPQESRTERNKQKRLCVTTPSAGRGHRVRLGVEREVCVFPWSQRKKRALTGQREPADGPRGISDDFSARKPYLNNNGSTTPLMIWDVAARQVVTVVTALFKCSVSAVISPPLPKCQTRNDIASLLHARLGTGYIGATCWPGAERRDPQLFYTSVSGLSVDWLMLPATSGDAGISTFGRPYFVHRYP